MEMMYAFAVENALNVIAERSASSQSPPISHSNQCDAASHNAGDAQSSDLHESFVTPQHGSGTENVN